MLKIAQFTQKTFSYCSYLHNLLFFYNKLFFLKLRYLEIYKECLKRWFNIQNYIDCFYTTNIQIQDLFNNYIPTQKDIEFSRNRIQEKIKEKPLFYKYYGK